MTTMASSKPRASPTAVSPAEESSEVQVLDSNEPLVATSSSAIPHMQVVDSSEPLVCELPCVQVIDSSEPLVPGIPSESSQLRLEPDSSDDASDSWSLRSVYSLLFYYLACNML